MTFFMKLALFFLDYLPLWIILVIRLLASGAEDNGADAASWVGICVLVGTTVIASGYVIRKLCAIDSDDVEDLVVVSCKKNEDIDLGASGCILVPGDGF